MRRIFNRRSCARIGLLGVLVVLTLLTACDKSTQLPHDDPQDGVVSIAYLKTFAAGSCTPLTEKLVIAGTVTANDCHGELRERIVVEDASGGISIALTGAARHRIYPIGTRLSIHCTALALCDYGGKVELGTGIEEGYTTPLHESEQQAHLHLLEEAVSWPRPRRITLDALTPDLIDSYVQLDRICFEHTGRWCTIDPETGKPLTTEHTLLDEEGRTLTLRVLGSATYANEPLPEGKGSLYGVIDYFAGRYSLRVVNRGFDF